eukprot:g738.t1
MSQQSTVVRGSSKVVDIDPFKNFDLSSFNFSPPAPAEYAECAKLVNIEFGDIKSQVSGARLRYMVVRPKDEDKIRGVVVFAHGIQEHMYRYRHCFDFLASKGWVCAAMDLRGHGQSANAASSSSKAVQKRRSCMDNTFESSNDLSQFYTFVYTDICKSETMKQCFMVWGQSYGACYTAHAVSRWSKENPEKIKGIVFTSGAFRVEKDCLLKVQSVFKPFALFICSEGRIVEGAPARLMCSQEEEVQRYVDDPLNVAKNIRIKTAVTIEKEIVALMDDDFAILQPPVLTIHSKVDKVCPFDGAEDFAKTKCTHPDSKMIAYGEGEQGKEYWHTLLFEKSRYNILGEILQWLESRRAKVFAEKENTK